VAHDMTRGGECGLPDGHGGPHRSPKGLERRRDYAGLKYWADREPSASREGHWVGMRFVQPPGDPDWGNPYLEWSKEQEAKKEREEKT
jgi:hypothetical protein